MCAPHLGSPTMLQRPCWPTTKGSSVCLTASSQGAFMVGTPRPSLGPLHLPTTLSTSNAAFRHLGDPIGCKSNMSISGKVHGPGLGEANKSMVRSLGQAPMWWWCNGKARRGSGAWTNAWWRLDLHSGKCTTFGPCWKVSLSSLGALPKFTLLPLGCSRWWGFGHCRQDLKESPHVGCGHGKNRGSSHCEMQQKHLARWGWS